MWIVGICPIAEILRKLLARDMQNRFFKFWISIGSVFEKSRIRFGMSLLRFGSKNAVRIL